ncbi:MAG TPA: DUF1778 domain-containing protein [Thermomicrobiales bacterium]|jgi:uncharacterized protein (DUF1778 family)
MAPAASNRKRERVEARVSAEQKALIERAAQLRGSSLSEYIVRSAQDAAERDLRDHEVITLSARDSQIFIEALLDPQPANAALRAATQEYQERWRAGDA